MGTIMNGVRFTCTEGDKGSISIRSTLDKSYRLDHRTDEEISFSDEDIVVIKNHREDPCQVKFQGSRLKEGKRAILRSSRRGTQTVRQGEELSYIMAGGEVITMMSDEWRAKLGPGQSMVV